MLSSDKIHKFNLDTLLIDKEVSESFDKQINLFLLPKELQENKIVAAQWHTALDEQVCPLCSSLQGQVFPVESAEFDRLEPPIHLNCRCMLSYITGRERGVEKRIEEYRPVDPDLLQKWSSKLYTKEEIREMTKELSEFGISKKNYSFLKNETEKWDKIFDSLDWKESSGATKDRIVNTLVEKLQKNKDFNSLIFREHSQFIGERIGARFQMPYFTDKEMTAWRSLKNFSDYEKFLKTLEPDLRRLISNEFFEASYLQVNDWIGSWAATSADFNPEAIALQMAVKDVFGIEGAMTHISREAVRKATKVYTGIKAKTMRAFVKAQYDVTQEFFKKNGIKSLTVYRGMTFSENQVKGIKLAFKGTIEKTGFTLQPSSSFSTNIKIATEFAEGRKNEYRAIIQSEIPVERILGTCQTGWGCKTETEAVVLGKKLKGKIFSIKTRGVLPTDLLEFFAMD